MNENVNDKLARILSGMNPEQLKNSGDAISKLLSSEAGKKLKNALSENDKKAILEKFMNMDTDQAVEKLKNADTSTLENLSADDILKKLR